MIGSRSRVSFHESRGPSPFYEGAYVRESVPSVASRRKVQIIRRMILSAWARRTSVASTVFLGIALAWSQVRSGNLRGQVVQVNGAPVASTNIHLVSFTANLTTPTGEFVLSVPPPLLPGDPVTLAVDGWQVRDPYQGGVPGGMYLPRSGVATIRVVVVPPNERVLNGQMVEKLAEQFAYSMVSVKPSPQRTLAQFSAAVAPRFQTKPETMEKAINNWGESAKEPYPTGLYLLLRGRFSDAGNQLRKVETVPAEVALGLAQFRLEDLKGAEFNWSRADQREPSNPIVMNNLAVVRFHLQSRESAQRLLSEALTVAERTKRNGQANVIRTNLMDLGSTPR